MANYNVSNPRLDQEPNGDWVFSFDVDLFEGQEVHQGATSVIGEERIIYFNIVGEEIGAQSTKSISSSTFTRQPGENVVEGKVKKGGTLVGTVRTTFP